MAIQYTIRNIPPHVDRELKARAKRTRRSFNQTVVDELSKTVMSTNESNFDWLAGTMDSKDAAEFDEAIKNLNSNDQEFWNN